MKQKTTKTTSTTSIKSKTKGRIDDYFVESIMIGSAPYFLAYNTQTDTIEIKEKISHGAWVYTPIPDEQQGYAAYAFTKKEIENLIENPPTKQELLDEIKIQIDRYLVVDELEKHVILGDLLLTYCQEWVDTVHYLFFVGENGSGKSSGCHLFRNIAYRCMYSEDISTANIYNFLGTDEEGAGTIAEDEAHEMNENKDKLRIYKNGYSKGSRIPKIIQTSNSKKQEFYRSFCFKVFAGEFVPKDRGFQQRLVQIRTIPSSPESNIKRPTKEEKQELFQLRKKLLVWKVSNTNQGITRIESGLERRDQEHWEDFLSCVYGTTYYEICKKATLTFTKKKHELIQTSFEATLFKIILKNIDEYQQINATKLWKELVSNNPLLPGEMDHFSKNTFHPQDHEMKLTKNSLYKILEEKFRVEKRITNQEGRQVTVYKFSQEVLCNFANLYKIEYKPQTVLM